MTLGDLTKPLLILTALAIGEIVLATLPWKTYGGFFSFSGTEINALGSPIGISDGHVIMALALGSIIAALSMVQRRQLVSFAIVGLVGLGIVFVSVHAAAGTKSSSELFGGTILGAMTPLDRDVLPALYLEIVLGASQALIASWLAMKEVRRTHERLIPVAVADGDGSTALH